MSQLLEPEVSGQELSFSNVQIEELFNRVADKAVKNKHYPGSTYRIQINATFTFEDVRRQVKYLHDLGISDLYASPYLRARAESTHGYDICDHNQLNPAIGTEEDYWRMVEELKKYGLGQILDTVPNHMGIGETCNQWWMDVLENGPSALHAPFFDIDWNPIKDELKNKVLLPILGDQYGYTLEKGELQLKFEPEEGAFYLDYYQTRLPVNPRTYPLVLQRRLETLLQQLGEENEHVLELQSIITSLNNLPPRWETDRAKVVERNREKEIIKRRLAAVVMVAPPVQQAINESLTELNGEPGNPLSFDELDRLIEEQSYRPAYWRVAAEEINYRRFFDINDLAALRMERPEVFEQAHALIMRFLGEGALQGLRIDHADGLWDPAGYFWRLQKRYFLELCRHELAADLGQAPDAETWTLVESAVNERLDSEKAANPNSPLLTPLFVAAEKILGRGENLPTDWTIDGTSGYEFGNQVNWLFVDSSNQKAFDDFYHKLIGEKTKFADLVYARKRQIMRVSLASEINVLARLLNRISEHDRRARDFTLNSLRFALREVMACFPVYRTYTVAEMERVDKRDVAYIDTAIARAKKRNPALDLSVFDFIRNILLLNWYENLSDEGRAMHGEFVMKFQQVSGPVMAKGLEDTAFYNYNRLISLNEVGGEPEVFGQTIEAFHRQNSERQKRWPFNMLTTSTHDTKRSEDVRARINVLSEMPRDWRVAVNRWLRFNRRRRTIVEGQAAPDRNDEYLFYQTLVGAWPFGTADDQQYENFISRMQEYMLKALKEAKVHTSWVNPNEAYDNAVKEFIRACLDRSVANPFLDDFAAFQVKIAHFGAFNSLSQLLLKLTSPGVPDIYQGNEIWDFSLVDSDNRRPVDYALRARLLADLPATADTTTAQQMVDSKEDGRIKLFVLRQALHFRNANRPLFNKGDYLPLNVQGNQAEHVCAFIRQAEGKRALIVAPRFFARLTKNALVAPLGEEFWRVNWLLLPAGDENARYRNVFTGEVYTANQHDGKPALPLAQVLEHFPVALLEKV